MYQSIRQEVTFKAKPETIYRMLMDAKAHSAFTGGPVELMNEIGGKLSAFGGAITGINIELVPNKRIVQMWRAGDWPEGHYSTATFELTAVEAPNAEQAEGQLVVFPDSPLGTAVPRG